MKTLNYYIYYMKINDAIQILKNNNYLIESKFKTDFEKQQYNTTYANTKQSYINRRAKQKTSTVDKYNNDTGRKWRYNKKHDINTLMYAFFDGICDCSKFYNYYDSYKHVDSYDKLKKIINANDDIKLLWEQCKKFLIKNMKGKIPVYRAFSFSAGSLSDIISSKSDLLGNKLINYLNNITKEFSSFTTSKNIALAYAKGEKGSGFKYNEKTHDYIIITGDAEPNDINYAFSAYLIGKHGDPVDGRYELNINNIKLLNNIRVVDFNISYKDVKTGKITKINKNQNPDIDNSITKKKVGYFDIVERRGKYNVVWNGKLFFNKWLDEVSTYVEDDTLLVICDDTYNWLCTDNENIMTLIWPGKKWFKMPTGLKPRELYKCEVEFAMDDNVYEFDPCPDDNNPTYASIINTDTGHGFVYDIITKQKIKKI